MPRRDRLGSRGGLRSNILIWIRRRFRAGTSDLPILLNPTGFADSDTVIIGSVDATESGGNLFWIVSISPIQPTPAEVISGLDHNGSPASADGSQPIVFLPPAQGMVATSLTPFTEYWIHFVHSNIEVSLVATTDTIPPIRDFDSDFDSDFG